MNTASARNNRRSSHAGGGEGGHPRSFSNAEEKKPAAPAPHTRGYLKLAGAAAAFHFDFRDRTVLDIGSSTGGFTQYALDHGAAKVIAIEKGTNQMASPLRHHSRLELHEKTDIFDVVATTPLLPSSPQPQGITRKISDFSRADAERRDVISDYHATKLLRRGELGDKASLGPMKKSTCAPSGCTLPEAPDIILADLSFTPLTKVLKYATMALARSDTDLLVMFKPQFAAHPNELRKGIVKNETTRRQIIKRFEFWLRQNHFCIINKHDNALAGKHGNLERFYWLRQSTPRKCK